MAEGWFGKEGSGKRKSRGVAKQNRFIFGHERGGEEIKIEADEYRALLDTSCQLIEHTPREKNISHFFPWKSEP